MKNLKQAAILFDQLYTGVNGFDISLRARSNRHIEEKSFTYGEIEFTTFAQIIQTSGLSALHTFYDLGTGTGKPVYATALVAKPKRAIGIELFSELVDEATILNSKFQRLQQNHHFPISTIIEFVCADILEYDWSDGDVIYVASTCFNVDFMEKIAVKAEQLKTGSKVITLTKELPSEKFHQLSRNGYRMTWGVTTVYMYEKK